MAVVEPSPALRQGLKLLLEEGGEFAVTGVYADTASLTGEGRDFDIVLINPCLIGCFRRFAVRSLLPELPAETLVAAIVYGYVDAETLGSFDGALDIYDDGPKLTRKLQNMASTHRGHQTTSAEAGAELSDREKEILISVAKGMTNKEIADRHFISIHTVISHRKNITRKTGIKTISGLTLYAMFNNLISQEAE
ncbi:MAG: LuxR C-terminal-related transcriptional regulator [Rikenellaceae bacterium]|nr:LuxR C-terminal-related transcriptional regulator [Rikenellaceae bacterium]